MAEIRMTWKVRGVLRLCDSFTGKPPILSSVHVRMEEGLSVIKKPDGLLVFVEGRNFKDRPSFRVCLESPVYVKTEITLSMETKPEAICVWMNPTERYPAPGGTSRLYGQTWPNASVAFCFLEEPHPMRLLSDVTGGQSSVRLYHPGRRSMEGRRIELEAGGKRKTIRLGSILAGPAPETNEYAVEAEDGFADFSRAETTVRLVHETRADEKGRYMLFFKDVKGKSASGRLVYKTETKQEEMTAIVRPGAVSRPEGPRE